MAARKAETVPTTRAKAAGRAVPDRRVLRAFHKCRAADVLAQAEFGPDREVACLTNSDFSSIDWIDALLDYAADVDDQAVHALTEML